MQLGTRFVRTAQESVQSFTQMTVYLCILNLLLSALATRLSFITHIPVITSVLQFVRILGFMSAFLVLLKTNPKLLAIILLFFAGLLLHSFAHLYWPSLNYAVPIQDYLLHPRVSSNYCFEASKTYLKSVLLFLLPSLVFMQAIGDLKNRQRSLTTLLFISLLVILIPNALIALIQGLMNLNFLAHNSGSAVGAERAVGLFEDGGASAVYFAILSSGLLFSLLKRVQIWWLLLLLWILSVAGGIMTAGRAFYLGLFVAGFVAFGFLCLRLLRGRSKNPRIFAGLLAALLSPAILLIWTPTPLKNNLQALQNFSWSKLLSLEGLNELIVNIDPVRAVNYKTMIKAFIEHPIKGTGLGSFYVNYFEHLDWALGSGGTSLVDPPSSLYLMLISELGIVGIALCLIFLLGLISAITWIAKLYLYRYDFDLPQGASRRSDVVGILANEELRHPNNAVANSKAIGIQPNLEIFDFFLLGALLALSADFWVGNHLIFKSVSSFHGLLLAWMIIRVPQIFPLPWKRVWLLLTAFLLLGVAYQWAYAPSPDLYKTVVLKTQQHQTRLNLTDTMLRTIPDGRQGQHRP